MSRPIPDDIPLGALVSITSRGRFIFLNNRLLPYGLSAAQFPVLLLLAKEQNITQDTLVRHFRLDKGTIARSVRKLEDGGYIRRITDPANRRAVRLFLTAKGRQAIPVLKAIDRAWNKQAYAGLSREESEAILRLMRRVAENSCCAMHDGGGDCNARD